MMRTKWHVKDDPLEELLRDICRIACDTLGEGADPDDLRRSCKLYHVARARRLAMWLMRSTLINDRNRVRYIPHAPFGMRISTPMLAYYFDCDHSLVMRAFRNLPTESVCDNALAALYDQWPKSLAARITETPAPYVPLLR